MMSKPILLPTSLVGSYPQPDWLIDRDELVKSVVRVSAEHLWLIDKEHREAAQDDATILAVRDQERAGLDIISDGEQSRESYSNHFANALEGVDLEKPGQTANRFGKMISVPRIAGPIRRKRPIEVHAVKLVRANTTRLVKTTVPGAFTMSVQAQDDYYKDPEALATAYAAAVNAEIKELFAAGADIVQLDEPWMVSFADRARKYGLRILDEAIAGATGKTAVHLCLGYAHVVKDKPSSYAFLAELEGSKIDQVSIETAEPKLDLAVLKDLPSKTIIIGVLNLGDMTIETPETVAGRIRNALKYVPAERLVIAPDCGMKYLPRAVAFGKMQAMVEGTSIVRKELN
jgi:5-methyltetrahydropteroyltriglutamate--homocysteine methyltransferase